MATFSEIKTNVLRNVIDSPAAVTAAAGDKVNAAMRTMQVKHNFRVMEAISSTFSTTASSHTLGAVPSDFKEFRGKSHVLRDNGSTRDLPNAAHREALQDIYTEDSASDFGEPDFIFIGEPTDVAGAASFEVYPFPDLNSDHSDGNYRVIVPYWKFLPALSADGDTNWFTVNGEEYLEFKATAECFAIDWDEQRMVIWEQKSGLKLKEVVDLDKKSRLAGVRNFMYRTDVNAPMLRR